MGFESHPMCIIEDRVYIHIYITCIFCHVCHVLYVRYSYIVHMCACGFVLVGIHTCLLCTCFPWTCFCTCSVSPRAVCPSYAIFLPYQHFAFVTRYITHVHICACAHARERSVHVRHVCPHVRACQLIPCVQRVVQFTGMCVYAHTHVCMNSCT